MSLRGYFIAFVAFFFAGHCPGAVAEELLANGDFESPGKTGEKPWNWCLIDSGHFEGLSAPGREGEGHAVGAVSDATGFRFVLWQQFYVVHGAQHRISVCAECEDLSGNRAGVGIARLGYTWSGGTDPNKSDVVWSATHSFYPWGFIDMGAVSASSDVLTVFLHGEVEKGRPNQRVRFDDAGVLGPTNRAPTPTQTRGPGPTPTPTYATLDRRFATNYGGFDGTEPGDDLLLKSMGIHPDEIHRYGCYAVGEAGPKTQFMVGHLDRYHSEERPYILDPDDLPDPTQHPDWNRLVNAAAKRPGSVYEVANEPDLFLYISPRAYAAWYHAWCERITSLDPTAKIMNGGLTWPIWNQRPADRKAAMASYTEEVPDTPNGYLETWRTEYSSQYGTYPPVDIWNIHVYSNNVQPAIPCSVCAMSLPEQKRRAPLNSIRMVESFRAFMESIGDGDKPLWITEMGILGTLGAVVDNPVRRGWKHDCLAARRRPDVCCGDDTGVSCLTPVEQWYEWQHEVFWIEQFYPWALESRKVQKMFWFITGRDTIPWTGAAWSNEIYWLDDEFTIMNPTGRALRAVIRKYHDSSPPEIDHVECSRTDDETTVVVHAHDTGPEGRMAGTAEIHYSVGSATGETDVQGWRWIPTTAGQAQFTLDSVPTGSYVNVKVVDAAGNESRMESLEIE